MTAAPAIHPSIPPKLADAMLKVRDLFVNVPSAFDPSGTDKDAEDGKGACITCQAAHMMGYRTSATMWYDYPAQWSVLRGMFNYTAVQPNLTADWAIKRIDTFLATAE
jgi:hypothetical protein